MTPPIWGTTRKITGWGAMAVGEVEEVVTVVRLPLEMVEVAVDVPAGRRREGGGETVGFAPPETVPVVPPHDGNGGAGGTGRRCQSGRQVSEAGDRGQAVAGEFGRPDGNYIVEASGKPEEEETLVRGQGLFSS